MSEDLLNKMYGPGRNVIDVGMTINDDALSHPWTQLYNSKSGWVRACAYGPSGGSTGLFVMYKSGVRCYYPSTPESYFHDLCNATSAGSWIHANVYGKTYYIV